MKQRSQCSRAGLLAAVMLVGGAVLTAGVPANPASAVVGDAAISGTVFELDDPVGHVVVSAYAWDEESDRFSFEQETYSDAAGEWELENLPDGQYTLMFSTAHSDARYALGQSLGGEPTVDDEVPQFDITDGEPTHQPFAEVELTRLGGALEVTLTDDDGEPLIDLDDAAALVRGVAATGEEWESTHYWSDEEGTILIPRIPHGGYVPWVSVGGSEYAPVPRGTFLSPGVTVQFGAANLPAEATTTFDVAATPRVEGELTAGSTVTADLPTLVPEPSQVQFLWTSAGELVADAAEQSLTLTESNIGQHVSAWIFGFADGVAPYIAVATGEHAVSAGPEPAPSASTPDSDASTGSGGDDSTHGSDDAQEQAQAGDDGRSMPATGSTLTALVILAGVTALAAGSALRRRTKA